MTQINFVSRNQLHNTANSFSYEKPGTKVTKLLKSVWIENYQIKDENQKCFRKQYGRRKKKHKNMILLTICLLVIVMGAWWWCLNSKKKCGSFPTINNISTFAKGRKAAFSFWGHHGSSILMTHLPGNL